MEPDRRWAALCRRVGGPDHGHTPGGSPRSGACHRRGQGGVRVVFTSPYDPVVAVADTLHAAAVDADVREQVQEGCVQKELRHSGLGGAGAALGATATAPRKGARAGSTAERQRSPRLADRQRTRRLEAARKAESDARRAARQAERELKQAQERRDRAAATLAEAEDALEAARRRVEETEREHARARQELDQI